MEKFLNIDAGPFYAILRFEEAATVLRAVFRLDFVERVADRCRSHNSDRVDTSDLAEMFGFTPQGTKTFLAVLHAMDVVLPHETGWSLTAAAKECLMSGVARSRRPYLQMGPTESADALIAMLRGNFPAESVPLYSFDDHPSLMEAPETANVAHEIAYGLASRARCFAEPLAKFILANIPTSVAGPLKVADLGAGSPFVMQAVLERSSAVSRAILVDQKAGLALAREMIHDELPRMDFEETDIFNRVPAADMYCMSNTAHDWLPEDYRRLAANIRVAMPTAGRVVVHEPLMLTSWSTLKQQHEALWMSCYALALYKLCGGRGTCYTACEHDHIMRSAGFERVAGPEKTTDGCSGLCYAAV